MQSYFFFIAFINPFIYSQEFTKITGQPIVSDSLYSEGSAWGDINGDRLPDLFVPDLYNGKNALYLNQGDGTFTAVADGPVVNDVGYSAGGSFGDFDNDGDLDLFVVNYFSVNSFLYINNGSGVFSSVTTGQIVNDGGWSFGSSTADYDNDGHLDIFVTNLGEDPPAEQNFLYRNNGDGTFTRVTNGPVATAVELSSSSSWCDYDNDGDQDLFVPNGGSFTPIAAENALYRNNGDGTFVQVNEEAGIDSSWAGFGSWGDYDNDGDFDLFVTNFGGDDNSLYRNNGDGTFTRITTGVIVEDGGDSVTSNWADYDNDGDLDLYVTNDFNEDNFLYRNNGDGTFSKVTGEGPVQDGGRSNGATWCDYDLDGFLDLFVPNGQRPVSQSNILYRNNGNDNHWINILCVGTVSNKSAIGARIRTLATIGGSPVWQLRYIAGSTGFNAMNSLNVEFGFGLATVVDSLIIEWPSGIVDRYSGIAVNRFYEAVEDGGLDPVVLSVANEDITPVGFQLLQNYPNPFNPVTNVEYRIRNSEWVSLMIFDLLGRNIKTLVNRRMVAGAHVIEWDGTNDQGYPVASGVYYYRLQAGEFVEARKMLLVR